MTTETLLFLLRIISALLLLGFVGAVFVMMWRDFRAASREVPRAKSEPSGLLTDWSARALLWIAFPGSRLSNALTGSW